MVSIKEVAQSIIETISPKGIISKSDLENYNAIWRNPITLDFQNYKLISMPPPSSGGIALSQLLMTLFHFDLHKI